MSWGTVLSPVIVALMQVSRVITIESFMIDPTMKYKLIDSSVLIRRVARGEVHPRSVDMERYQSHDG